MQKFAPASRTSFLLGWLAFILLGVAATARDLLPIGIFFDQQSIQSVVISPDGTKVAMIAPNQGRYSIAVMDLKTGAVTVPVHFKDENIRGVFWKGNDRLLFTSAIAGHEVPLLASIDVNGRGLRRILEPRRTPDDFSIFFGNLVDRFPANEDQILITGYTDQHDARKINPSSPVGSTPSVYRVNVKTGRRLPVVGLDRGVSAGWFDRDGNQRMTTQQEGLQTLVRVRERNDQPWRTIKTFELADERWRIAGMSDNGETAYIIDYTEADRGALKALNVRSGEFTATLFEPPAGEIQNIIRSPKRDRILGVVYEGVDIRYHWFDPQWAAMMQAVTAQFPRHVVLLTSIADDEKRFVVRTFSDRDPGHYYLVEMGPAGLRLQSITPARPAIKPEQMAAMQPIQYTARDGLVIHGYLTKPVGSEGKRVPLLIMPHGGPFGPRDSWGFNPEVQFLANRGYAVLQPNFRGSGGYGLSFMHAGYQEWGGKMQDDLTDAVKWAIDQGHADPSQVGIIGASYGGYAALAGLVFTPELYRVGINYVGVSDLRLITRYDLAGGRADTAWQDRAIGRDPAMLKERSPVEHVANIRVPSFHAYGRNDPRVRFENWEVLERELKRHNKPYEVQIETKEGHGFEKEEAALKFYGAVEQFLTKHMPAN
ncbi:MAG: S9 family peptidase [Opitutaceae bacterium]|nr:S9 family peptidase [Opitutaceae bacterium]